MHVGTLIYNYQLIALSHIKFVLFTATFRLRLECFNILNVIHDDVRVTI